MKGKSSDSSSDRRSGSAFVVANDSTPLRAGPLTLRFDAGDLRYIKLGEREVIRRIYAAVRDRNWGTVPFELSNLKRDVDEAQFHITYTSTHRQNEIRFVWKAEIVGAPDGSIRFTFDGEAQSTFLRSRIGFCVLHPMLECAGAKGRARHADGSEHEVSFPILVAPDQPASGFHDLVGLAHEIEPDCWAEIEFSGDLFETEDQRNWIDASFKTYCTPVRIPYPVEVKAGTRVRQEVRLKIVDGRPKTEAPSQAGSSGSTINYQPSTINYLKSDSAVSISLTNERRALPSIGLSVASHGQPLTDKEIERLSMLGLWHLRCDVRLARPAWPESLRLAAEQAVALNVPLELAVHLPRADGEIELEALGARLRELNPDVVRVLLFREGEETLSLASLRFARPHLAFLNAPIGAGTDADFYQLNQNRPPHADADFIHWSMNPQVHAFDLASLAEAPAAIRAQLQSAEEFFPGKPLVVSPVTLKPRFNPVADGPEAALPPGELPPQVDARQLSTFAGGWTLAALKYLAEAGAESVTLFETTGWLGVMERTAGSSLPAKFPSWPLQVFPLFYVIGSVNGFGGGQVILTRSSDPLRVESLLLFKKGWACLWLANLTDQMQTATVRGFKKVTHRYHIQWDLPQVWMALPAVMLHDIGSPLPAPVENEIEVYMEPYGLHRLELEL